MELTEDQQNAYLEFTSFLVDPHNDVMVIEGFAGTGKSTLVAKLLTDYDKIVKSQQLLVNDGSRKRLTPVMTATTNKACESLSRFTGRPVQTVHSLYMLVVKTDYKTNSTSLTCRGESSDMPDGKLIFVDEASYIDRDLLNFIVSNTKNSKIVFIGDPAQLTPIKCKTAPVFEMGFPTARLSQVVRQAEGNQIMELATSFRNSVMNGDFFQFAPNDVDVIRVDHDDLEDIMFQDFSRPDWNFYQSKVLAWTNARVTAYNQGLRNQIEGDPHLSVGDMAVCNQYIANKRCKLRTDQIVQITGIAPDTDHGFSGFWVDIDNKHEAFLPQSLEMRKQALKKFKSLNEFDAIQHVQENWIDLRAAYACTINKSQGSTFDRVYVDLNDISKCNVGSQIARMLYVAVSRAREKVYLVGDLV